MKVIDCFNGDADGICALTQLRLAKPVESVLVTGVKRDIQLLERVEVSAGDQVNVLDVSLDKNRQGLESILAQGAEVFYCDHHFAGELPAHENLTTLINTSANVCTSLLINQHLKDEFLEWAVVGTFGDNLKKSAHGMAKFLELSSDKLEQLENLGIYLNYNGYGASLEDLYFHPADLFKHTSQHASAFAFMRDDVDTFETLESGYHQDMSKAAAVKPRFDVSHAAVFELPDQLTKFVVNLKPAAGGQLLRVSIVCLITRLIALSKSLVVFIVRFVLTSLRNGSVKKVRFSFPSHILAAISRAHHSSNHRCMERNRCRNIHAQRVSPAARGLLASLSSLNS